MKLKELINQYRSGKILLIGHSGHGKTTLAKSLGLLHSSSSRFALYRVLWKLPAVRQLYKDAEQCYADRHNHRLFWHQEIRKYNRPDPTRLARELLENFQVYDGMRNDSEFSGCMKAELFDLVLWVGRAGVPPESSKSMKLSPDYVRHICHRHRVPFYILDNSGDIGDVKVVGGGV